MGNRRLPVTRSHRMFRVRERFTLADDFLAQFKGRQPEWGPLGYVTYKRTYARVPPR